MIRQMMVPGSSKTIRMILFVILLFCLGSVLTYAVYLSGELDAERERHKAAAMELHGQLALAHTEINLLQSDQREQGRVIAGLQLQVRQTQGTLAREREAAAGRSFIVAQAKNMPVKSGEVVDAQTSRKIIRHLNAALQRQ